MRMLRQRNRISNLGTAIPQTSVPLCKPITRNKFKLITSFNAKICMAQLAWVRGLFWEHLTSTLFLAGVAYSRVDTQSRKRGGSFMRAQSFIISISLGGAPCVGDGEANWIVGRAVHIGSCQHTGIYNSLAHSWATICHLYWRDGGYPWLNPNTNMY